MEDAQIIELFFARSEDAISELDKKYGKLCHKLADNILASAQDAEECVNDAYLSTWNAIPPQRPESLPAFVGTLVRRCSITRYRANTAMKRNSHYDMCMEELETFLASPQQAMEEHYAARELAAAIERFLDTQSKENRVLFMRRYWYADSFAEIGKLLGITEGNARLRLTRMSGSAASAASALPRFGFIHALSWRSCNSLTNSLLLSIISSPVLP